MKEREWALGDDTVEEFYEYKNLGVLKNYCGSFASNISDNVDKTRKKAGMIFSSNADRRKTNPLIYVKFWRQACLPSLLFGAELLTIRLTLFCENYYFTKKITNLRRKLLICEENYQSAKKKAGSKSKKVGSKSRKVGSKSKLLICEENY